MIHIMTGADERFSPGLLVMAASALVALSPKEEVTFHILNGGIQAQTLERLRRVCQKLHGACQVIDYPVNEANFSHMPLGPGQSRMNYARLHMGTLLSVDKVLYLDSDILVLKDLSEIWNADMQGKVALACPDFISRLESDCPWPLNEDEKAYPYFNSGFMIIDLQRWREQAMEEAILELAAESGTAYRLHDQTLLNYVLRGKVALIDPSWNWVHHDVSDGGRLMDANLHFTGQKPWLFFDGSLRFRLWRLYYRRLVGPLSELFLTKAGRSGFIGGWTEIIIRSHPIIRMLYLRLIERRLRSTTDGGVKARLGAILRYYTTGLGGPSEDGEKLHASAIVRSAGDALRMRS